MPSWLQKVGKALAVIVPFAQRIAQRRRASQADPSKALQGRSRTAEAVEAEVRRQQRERGERP